MASEKQRFIAAERQQESGGDYQAVNGSSGALGAYQVMPANLPGWLAQSGQRDMSDQAYLNCNSCQDKLAWDILGGYYDTYGPAGAAAMWYSGQPDPNATFGNPPVYVYVQDVLALMGDPNLPIGPGPPGGGGGGAGGPPIAASVEPWVKVTARIAQFMIHQDAYWQNWTRSQRTGLPGANIPTLVSRG